MYISRFSGLSSFIRIFRVSLVSCILCRMSSKVIFNVTDKKIPPFAYLLVQVIKPEHKIKIKSEVRVPASAPLLILLLCFQSSAASKCRLIIDLLIKSDSFYSLILIIIFLIVIDKLRFYRQILYRFICF
jgi:hypothetical protein